MYHGLCNMLNRGPCVALRKNKPCGNGRIGLGRAAAVAPLGAWTDPSHVVRSAKKGKSLCGSVLHKYIVLPLMELLLAFPK
jgi:hypothetical protein